MTFFPDIAGHIVGIEFERVGAGIGDLPGMLHPAARGDAVQAGNHRDRQRGLECGDLFQVAVQLTGEVLMTWQIAVGLGMAGLLVVQKARHALFFSAYRLFEQ